MKRIYRTLILVMLTAAAAGGCGARLEIRAERLGSVTLNSPDEQLRASLPALAANAKSFYEELGRISREASGVKDTPPVIQQEIAYFGELQAELKATDIEKISSARLRQLASEAQARFGPIISSADAAERRRRILQRLGADEKNAKMFEAKAAALQKLDAMGQREVEPVRIQVAAALSRIHGSSMYGGYVSRSVYLINPGSAHWDRARELERRGDQRLVFSRVNALAFNDSTLMVVQESPGQFEPRYLEADPETAIRNTLKIVSAVLRVAARFVPMVNVALGTVHSDPSTPPAAAPPAAPTATAVTVDQADQRVAELKSRVDGVLANSALQAALGKLRAGQALNESEKALVVSKAQELLIAADIHIDQQP